jgi:hypothetical protein
MYLLRQQHTPTQTSSATEMPPMPYLQRQQKGVQKLQSPGGYLAHIPQRPYYPLRCGSARVPGIRYTAKMQKIRGHEIPKLKI